MLCGAVDSVAGGITSVGPRRMRVSLVLFGIRVYQVPCLTRSKPFEQKQVLYTATNEKPPPYLQDKVHTIPLPTPPPLPPSSSPLLPAIGALHLSRSRRTALGKPVTRQHLRLLPIADIALPRAAILAATREAAVFRVPDLAGGGRRAHPEGVVDEVVERVPGGGAADLFR